MKPGNLPETYAVSGIEEYWIEKCCYFLNWGYWTDVTSNCALHISEYRSHHQVPDLKISKRMCSYIIGYYL